MADCTNVLNLNTINPGLIGMQSYILHVITKRSYEIEEELNQGIEKPYKKIIRAHIGDCQATGQKPLTFVRQVIAAALCPELQGDDNCPQDVKERVKRILSSCRGGSLGSYCDHMAGMRIIRQDVASFITRRDGHESDWRNVVITAGASDGIKSVFNMLSGLRADGKRAGVMIPIPQYPIFSSFITLFGLHQINYYLDEENSWSLDIGELKRALEESRAHSHPTAIVVINPGNPTGQVLSRENIEAIIRFAHQEHLLLLADEVYQDNICVNNSKFYSFKKVLCEMGPEFSSQQLISFMSASKGFLGECGIRGGYLEFANVDIAIQENFHKMLVTASIAGQIVLDCYINPPVPGDPSYELFMQETSEIKETHKRKAQMISEMFKSADGLTCNEVQGALYCYPRIHLPQKAIDRAKEKGLTPDEFYCLELLEQVGVLMVPGVEYGQKPGTYHIRSTTLTPIEEFQELMDRYNRFHKAFMDTWSQ